MALSISSGVPAFTVSPSLTRTFWALKPNEIRWLNCESLKLKRNQKALALPFPLDLMSNPFLSFTILDISVFNYEPLKKRLKSNK